MTKYWSYQLQEVIDSKNAYNGVENVKLDIFKAVDRETAKQHLKEIYPGLPFRKPRNAENGARYLYLVECGESWYNFKYSEETVVCDYCGKTVTIIGEGNVPRSSQSSFCTNECRDTSVEKEFEEQINKDDHVAVIKKDGIIVGYAF